MKSAVVKQNPWSMPFETPLDLNQAFSLASAFIDICPYSNPELPVTAFTPLMVTTPMNETCPGHNISVGFWPPTSYFDSDSSNSTFSNSTDTDSSSSNSTTTTTNSTAPSTTPQYFLALLSGLDKQFVPLMLSNTSDANYYMYEWTAMLPGELKGTVYALVTSDNSTVTDDNTVAGVAVLDFPFNSNGTLLTMAGDGNM